MDETKRLIMCPNCGCIEIEGLCTVHAKIYSDGVNVILEESSKISWNDDNEAWCNSCGWQGIIKNAIVTEPPQGCLLVNKGKEI